MKYNLNIDASISKDGLNSGLYPVIIYQLIKQYSCESHKITVTDIQDTLSAYWKGDKDKASTKTNLQRTIKRNLQSLLYFDTNIHAEDSDHNPFNIDADTAVGKIHYLWYEQELNSWDLQILSNSLVYSKHLEKSVRTDLLEKLLRASGYGSVNTNSWVIPLIQDSDDLSVSSSPNLYRNLSFIYEAIANKNCLTFEYIHTASNATENTIRSYVGFSPYKIIQDEGVFFVLGSSLHNDPNLFDIYRHKNIPFPVRFLEVHRINKICTDYEHTYLSIDETQAQGRNIVSLIGSPFNVNTSTIFPTAESIRVVLHADSFGLDAICDRYANRMAFKALPGRRNNDEDTYFEIIIKDYAPTEWERLITLLLRYSGHLSLIHPKECLNEVLSLIQ